jgi:hypothetical protein
MGTIILGDIIDRARVTLLELDSSMVPGGSNTRWSRIGDLLVHGNASIREISAEKRDEYVQNEPFELAPGAKQTLPPGGVQFFNAEHNLGADGETPGTAILLMDRTALTRQDRNWMVATGPAVERIVHDQRDPKTFYVYPRPAGSWYISALWAAVPPAIEADDIDDVNNGVIPINDFWDTAIHDYIVGYAYLKNAWGGEASKAGYFIQKFYNAIGRKFEAQMIVAPLDADAAAQTPDGLGKA